MINIEENLQINMDSCFKMTWQLSVVKCVAYFSTLNPLKIDYHDILT